MRIVFSDMQAQLDVLEREAEQVVEVYNHAKWEDEVKSSYTPYISQCGETNGRVNSIKNGLEETVRLAGNVEKSSVVKSELDEIKLQADSIVV